MGFLLRCAFWLSLALLIIPIDTGTQNGERETIGPLEAVFAAREAVQDIAGLCERKPDVCEAGQVALHTIGARARESMRIAAELLDGSDATGAADAEKHTAAIGDSETTDTAVTTGSVTKSD